MGLKIDGWQWDGWDWEGLGITNDHGHCSALCKRISSEIKLVGLGSENEMEMRILAGDPHPLPSCVLCV